MRLFRVLALHALALVLALVLAPASQADDSDKTLDQSLVRYRGLQDIVKLIGVEARPEKDRKKVLVTWLIDNSSSMSKHHLHEELADGIATGFKGFADKQLHMAVVTLGENPQVSCPITEDLDRVQGSIKELAKTPDDTFKNAMDGMRIASNAMKQFDGIRILVLFTLENGDNEDNIEATRQLLKQNKIVLQVITREAIYSDPWWPMNGSRYKDLGFDLTGQDAPYNEYPLGWIFDRMGVYNTVASGYGIYALSRLAHESGGKYYTYYPDVEGRSFCSRGSCLLCGAKHANCDPAYNLATLSKFAPSVDSRDEYRAEMSSERIAHAIQKSWETAWEGGLCTLQSSLESKGKSIRESKGGGNRDSIYASGGNWKDLARRGKKGLKECEKAIRQLEGVINTTSGGNENWRLRATADTMLAQLYATHFNLRQLILFAEAMESLRKSPAQPDAFGKSAFEKYRGKDVVSYTYDNVWFCHGGKRVMDVRFLNGKNIREEQQALAERIDRNIGKYQGTPWENQNRHVGLSVFRPIMPAPPVQATTTRPKRDHKKSQSKDSTTESPNKKTTNSPGRPSRPGRGSAPGGGGTTQSGG